MDARLRNSNPRIPAGISSGGEGIHYKFIVKKKVFICISIKKFSRKSTVLMRLLFLLQNQIALMTIH